MSAEGSPPPGGDQNQAPMLRAVLSAELAVAATVIFLRFYTRLKLIRNLGMDDWVMLAAFVSKQITKPGPVTP